MEELQEAILNAPHDKALWRKYQELLEKHNDPRGRLIELKFKEKNESEQNEYYKLWSESDKYWGTKFLIFDGRVRNLKQITVHLTTYGSAPKKYGKGAYKVGLVESVALKYEGWEYLGSGRNYHYVRPYESYRGKAHKPKIIMWVPEKEEMEKLAFALAKETEAEKRSIETFGWWITEFEAGGRKAAEAFHTGTFKKGGYVDDEVGKIWEWYTEKKYTFGLDRMIYTFIIEWDINDMQTVNERID